MQFNSIGSGSIHLTDNTTIKEFRRFVNNLDNHAKLRAKIQEDGTYILKISNKSSGTGVKDGLFDTVKRRRDNTRIAIWKFANGLGATDLASKMINQMNSNHDLFGAEIKDLLAAQLPSEMPSPDRSLDDELGFLDMRNGQILKDTEEGVKKLEPTVFNFFTDIKKYMNADPSNRKQAGNEHLAELAHIWDKATTSTQMMFAGNASTEADQIYAITKSFLDKAMGSPLSFPNGREIFAAACVPERAMALALNELLIAARKGNIQKVPKCAEELKLDLWLANLKTAASLFTNEAYLNKIPKDRRVQIGIAGYNMAKLASKFEDPAGQFQAVRRLVEEAKTSPATFVQLVQRNLGTIDQPIKTRAARHFDSLAKRANLKPQQRNIQLRKN